MIRVLVADDHTITREGLKQLLLAAGDLDVVGEARDGFELNVGNQTELVHYAIKHRLIDGPDAPI